VAIANALQLEAAPATPAPSRFTYNAMPGLKSIAVLQRCCCWYITLRRDLDLWPLTLNICSVSSVTWWNYVPNLNAVEQSAAELLRLQCLTLWPWTSFKCCAWLWDNFHQIWHSTTYPCLNYSVFWCWYVMSSCELDLWPVDLESSWYIKCHVVKVCTKFERNRTIPGWIVDNFANFCTRYVTLWPWPLTSWRWTFTALRVSCA